MINDLYLQLKLAVPFDDWSEDKNLLLFENGVLNIKERVLMPFDKELYITQRLPYEYNPYSTCEPIIKWLKDTQDQDWSRVQVLRAWLRAVLLSCSDIQKFVEIPNCELSVPVGIFSLYTLMLSVIHFYFWLWI